MSLGFAPAPRVPSSLVGFWSKGNTFLRFDGIRRIQQNTGPEFRVPGRCSQEDFDAFPSRGPLIGSPGFGQAPSHRITCASESSAFRHSSGNPEAHPHTPPAPAEHMEINFWLTPHAHRLEGVDFLDNAKTRRTPRLHQGPDAGRSLLLLREQRKGQ